MTCYSLQFYTI